MVKVCARCGRAFETDRSVRQYCSYSCSNSVTAEQRERRNASGQVTAVWSCGGGVQSTAIAALIVRGKLPRPDYAVMTDCGYEKRATMEHVHGVLEPALASVGVRLVILPTYPDGGHPLIDASGHVVIPAYRQAPDGHVIKLRTHCNEAWKVKPVKRWMRAQGGAGMRELDRYIDG